MASQSEELNFGQKFLPGETATSTGDYMLYHQDGRLVLPVVIVSIKDSEVFPAAESGQYYLRVEK